MQTGRREADRAGTTPSRDVLVRLRGRLSPLGVDERADGGPQDVFDVADERAQEPHVLGASDQTGLLGEFGPQPPLEATLAAAVPPDSTTLMSKSNSSISIC